MRHRFFIADVFSNRPFGGNQLAVFPDARGLAKEQMQSLAREFNFAESTFVFPATAAGSAASVRIFTPRRELDFAGHPTIGTAAVLTSLGLIGTSGGSGTAVLDEGIGPVEIGVDVSSGGLHAELTLKTAVEIPAAGPNPAGVAATLSLPVDAVVDSWFASVGLPFCFVHLKDPETVDRAVLDRGAWAKELAAAWSPHLFFFAGELVPGSLLYARMFAPALGIEEDAATGSGAATLAGVAAQRLADLEGTFRWTINQGVKLGRPSTLEIAATKRNGVVTHVQVGGFTVIVAEGQMDVPS